MEDPSFKRNTIKVHGSGVESNPLVSILMPFRNTEKYLRECLDSVRKQEYSKWKLLAVNDHSEDRCGQIVNEYGLRDSRILLMQNKGKGIIPALRTVANKTAQSEIRRSLNSLGLDKPADAFFFC